MDGPSAYAAASIPTDGAAADTDAVRWQLTDHVARITLNRPEALNALDPPAMRLLRNRLETARDNSDVRVVLLSAEGDRTFCTGADLKRTSPPSESYGQAFLDEPGLAASRGIYGRLLDIRSLKIWKPIIAAVDGYCLGGGLELALQCDIVIASAAAVFGLPEVTVGSIPGVGGVPLLLEAIPRGAAMRLALSGERIDAQEAHRLGLVTEICPSRAEAEERALVLAQRIARNAPLAVQAVKRLAFEHEVGLGRSMDLSELIWGALRDTEDRIEGRSAFADRRAPVFKGR